MYVNAKKVSYLEKGDKLRVLFTLSLKSDNGRKEKGPKPRSIQGGIRGSRVPLPNIGHTPPPSTQFLFQQMPLPDLNKKKTAIKREKQEKIAQIFVSSNLFIF